MTTQFVTQCRSFQPQYRFLKIPRSKVITLLCQTNSFLETAVLATAVAATNQLTVRKNRSADRLAE